MTKKDSSKPELIEDKDLDQASGGLIQKVGGGNVSALPPEPTAASDYLLQLDGIKLQQRP